ncbi:serine/threonine-protein phosphatase 1 regulatory subunit 10 isoform X2 [Manduca sexta]|uniref:Serine/threonine-protein phosphatase 1 regulatory subunit 10 n=2 Tax=Manduca sexta TaxID=7130 RepID=A0A922CHY6_MANSE|nr:serine/threonine-protein phosphatase 1 regulatory subunit 10 isoform X2 [Manduca sexta]KAG6446283.1 hypothetical protein O3G_MSEX004360 [Manduca sexta]
MPRIDPIQLLNCLSVLLSPHGGIKSRDEVQRLAHLMTKFSKKLVSKCIYVQILKCTETDLLGLFMGSGGWMLVHTWLTESIVIKNWPLVRELLELLLLCPVDIERLKTNNCPKLVKELSKDGNHFAIRALASKLVEQWLKIVKGERVVPVSLGDLSYIISEAKIEDNSETAEKHESCSEQINIQGSLNNSETKIKIEENSQSEVENEIQISDEDKVGLESRNNAESPQETEGILVLKFSLKDGKQIVSTKVDDNEKFSDTSDTEKSKDKHKSRSKEKSNSSSSSSSKSSSKHSSRSSSSDKHKSSHRSSSSSSRHNSKDKKKDKSSHSSKSKSDSSRKSSDKSSSSGVKLKDERSSKSSDKDKKEKENKEKNDKNKVKSIEKSENKPQVPSIHKLGKIPKLSDVKREKPSISIEVRKPDEPKPKTVKTFHSKFRKHGLEEEVKPPPSRASLLSKKVPPALPPTVAIPKRPSPVHTDSPPEKKHKPTEIVEKPGSIKLIPPKPKPMMLLESDMFMDALNASATNKKEPKKRKRRTSGSKDGNAPGDGSPPHTPTTLNSPNSENKSVPPRFYQDTLEAEESKEKAQDRNSDTNETLDDSVNDKETEEKINVPEPHTLTVNGLKGVLCYHKKKGPKKSIKWKPDSELEEIQYFELDETERVNVTKTSFTDMKYLERINEREAFQKARNLSNDDIMEEKTNWRPLILVDVEGQLQVEYGKNSKEKDIQAIRQKGTLQPLYFHKSMIPDTPFEPDPETHQYSEPTIIPLEDATGNQDNISDFRNMPWPEPKGNAPPATTNISVPPMFPNNISQFPNNFPNPQFPGVPGFQGPNIVPGEWQNGMTPPMMPNGMPGPMVPANMAPNVIPPGNMPPNIMMPPDNMMMGPEMFGPNQMYPGPPESFNMQQNMFPLDFNMSGPQGPDGFPGPGNFRGPMRGRGAGGWRGKGPNNWDNGQRGRGGARGGRKAVCIYFQRKGSCRQGDNCTFLHPGVNCPY